MLHRIVVPIDRWFTAPEPGAAGRTGVYRIVYSLFYLWHLRSHHAEHLGGLPTYHRTRILLVEWLGGVPESTVFLGILESSLVGAPVILMAGYRARIATATVLALGGLYEAYFMAAANEHSTVFLTIYLPLFMLLADSWGATYSLDARLQRRAGRPVTDPGDSSGHHWVGVRAVPIMLAALFLSAAVLTVGLGSTWLTRSGLFANRMLDTNVQSAVLGLPVNPLAPWFARMPGIADALSCLVVLFEGRFLAILFSQRIPSFYVPLALLFHTASALGLLVTFTPILIVYGVFVDWQAWRQRLWPRRITLLDSAPSGALVLGTLVLAVAAGVLSNLGAGLRAGFNLPGLLTWRTIWYPVLALALLLLVRTCLDFVRGTNRGASAR